MTGQPYRVRPVPVAPDPLIGGAAYDYADAFELRLDRPDAHTAEQWFRAGLAQGGPVLRGIVRFAHGRVLRLALSSDAASILGWRTLSSTADALHLCAEGPLLCAEIVARRRSETTATLTTFLAFRRRRTRLLWLLTGPVHRRVAPYLLGRAAARLTRSEAATGPSPG